MLLVCFDALEPVLDCDFGPKHAGDWPARARAVLGRARSADWVVAHVLTRASDVRSWRAMAGLAPLPAEPVFYREDGPAFSNPAFADLARRYPAATLVLIGASRAAACLATAVCGIGRGRAVMVVADAVAASAAEWRGLGALAGLGCPPGLGSLKLPSSRQLLPGAGDLRLVIGGKG
jgi:hypothetical protein